ncbi:MAG: LD-carboxypeptidase [Lachnospirales bacterium]
MKGSIIALSSGLGGVFPHIRDLGVNNLKELYDIESVVCESAKMFPDEVRNNPKLRADELNNALADDTIDYVHALIGGDDSIRINEYINLNLKDKKIVGFSDATCYLTYLASQGKSAIYGASILAGMAQAKFLGEDFIKNFYDVVISKDTVLYPKYDFYVEGYRNWGDKDNKGEILEKKVTKGPIVLQGSGKVSGKLFGGCINSLEQIKGTKYYPNKEYLKDKILFFEVSDEKISPEQFRRMLYSYAIQGIFNSNKAVMFGIFKDYSDDEKEKVYKYIKDVLIDEYGFKCPIVLNCPFGHTAPTWFLPYNEIFEIDLDNVEFRVLR